MIRPPKKMSCVGRPGQATGHGKHPIGIDKLPFSAVLSVLFFIVFIESAKLVLCSGRMYQQFECRFLASDFVATGLFLKLSKSCFIKTLQHNRSFI